MQNDKSRTLQVYNRAERGEYIPKVAEEFWQGRVLTQGCCMLIAGSPKTGKSYFFIEMALRAASGGVFLDHQFSRPLKVMYIQAEIDEGYLEERQNVFKKSCSDEARALIEKNFYYSNRLILKLDNEQDLDNLCLTVLEIQPDLICLDPIVSYANIDENSSEAVSQLLYDHIGDLKACINPEPAVVLIHHFGKAPGSTDIASLFRSVRGSTAWLGWYDTGIVLRGDGSKTFVHYQTRNQLQPASHQIELNHGIGAWQIVDEKVKDNKKIEQAISILSDAASPLTSIQLRDKLMACLDISKRSAYGLISDLKNHPKIKTQQFSRQNVLFKVIE